jgi:hypothetical protein
MATQDDMVAEHLRTWHGFCRLMAAAAAVVAVVLAVLLKIL